MNNTTFVGNLVRKPDLRTSASGKNRATFTVAVNEGERGTDSERTHFVNVTAFGSALHVTGEDADALQDAVREFLDDRSLRWSRAEPGLEDVFIHLMRGVSDSVQ